jgi:predicted kinase
MVQKKSNTTTKTNNQTFVLVLTGLPGSGKSTISTELEKSGWIRISQDELGSLQECKSLFEKSLKKGRSVIVDRCNVHDKERKIWTNDAKRFGIQKETMECLFINTPMEECIKRVQNRKKHPTLSPENGEEVIKSFGGSLKPPTEYEPFNKIHEATSDVEMRNMIKLFSNYPINKK